MISHSTFDAPFGRMLLAWGPHGVLRVAFDEEEGLADLDSLARANGGSKRATNSELSRWLERYFSGRQPRVDPRVDLRATSSFSQRVLGTLRRKIGWGRTVSYGELALLSGHARAARAVGRALHTNPVAILVPCHRVVASDGTLGGFGGGLTRKRILLQLEGISTVSA